MKYFLQGLWEALRSDLDCEVETRVSTDSPRRRENAGSNDRVSGRLYDVSRIGGSNPSPAHFINSQL